MKFADLFRRFKGKKMNKAELAVLRVSMLVAALDGDVCKEELEEFQKLAKECEGYSEAEVKKAFSDTLRAAGYLMLLARVAEQSSILDAFIVEAETILPAIADFGPVGINDAVEVWTGMAKADGDFSEIERLAIESLEKLLIIKNQAQTQSVGSGIITRHGFSM